MPSRAICCVSSVIFWPPTISSCFSYIFLRLMHCIASRFLFDAMNFFAFVTSTSTLRWMCASRFCIVSMVSRILLIASSVVLPARAPLFAAAGAGAGAVATTSRFRPKRFIEVREEVKRARTSRTLR